MCLREVSAKNFQRKHLVRVYQDGQVQRQKRLRRKQRSRTFQAQRIDVVSLQSKATKRVISRENCSLLPAKRPLIFNRSEPLLSTVSTRTETNFPVNVLLEDTGASVLGPSWKYCQEIFAP